MEHVESITPLKPSTKKERITELDALRGFALLGVLLMNIEYFTNTMQSLFLGTGPVFTGIDLVADRFTSIFIEGKFWVMFSLLFGMGFAVIQSRIQDTGRNFSKFYAKRMFVLLLIGAAHAIFIWTGDILFSYAVTGFVLIFFRNTKTTRLWKYALFFFLLIVILSLFGGEVDPKAAPDEFTVLLQKQFESANTLYPNGSFIEVTKLRLLEFAFNSSMLIVYLPYFLSVFLFGNWLYKIGLFNDLKANKNRLKQVLYIALPLGLFLSIPPAIVLENSNLMSPASTLESQMISLDAIASFLLCMAYVAGFLLLAINNTFNLRSFLAPAGRMALSNYILQSLFFTTLFYGYGIGLWGEVSRAALVPMAVLFFIVQCALSKWWLKSHSYGPLEWVWRKLTYGKI